jgi:hypothetical protein
MIVSATYAAGAITGTWSESTRNAAGTLSGKVEGVAFQVVAKGPTFTANLNLVTRGDKQSVTIRSQETCRVRQSLCSVDSASRTDIDVVE